MQSIEQEISRRRTFAIISHPDAGKTTLTEKFLLYGGAVHLAGSVTARKNQRATTSDWMELEKNAASQSAQRCCNSTTAVFRSTCPKPPGPKIFLKTLTAGYTPRILSLWGVLQRKAS